jgi:type IV secretory pathway VirB10-like protein
MAAFNTRLPRRPQAVGVRLAVVLMILLVVSGAWVGAYWWAKRQGHLKPVERALAEYDYGWPAWMSKGAKKATYTEPEPNGVAGTDPREEELKRLKARMDAQDRELAALRSRQATTATATQTAKVSTPPPTIKRPPMYFVSTERKPEAKAGEALYATAPWTYIPCVLENVLNSEIPGHFTVRTTRPVWDVTGTYQLIPQGQRIGAKAVTANLLFGNERIPTFALSVAMPDGSAVDLGDAPIMDAAGTNGLTGEVNNHIWRLVWTSVLIEGLRAGQQVINQGIANQSDGVTVTGIGQYSGHLAQQRLGRAQDTRPTITAQSGEQCQVLLPKPLSLPAVTLASR